MRANGSHGVISRRALLGGAAAAAALLGGCMGVRLALPICLGSSRTDPDLRDRALRAFVTTVVPVAREDAPNLVRVFSDPDYPFLPRRDVFVHDLRARARRLRGATFEELAAEEREATVSLALAKGGVTERLYRAAILLAQASFYGGIYGGGCAYLGVPPEDARIDLDELSYPDAAAYMAREATADGNPA